MPNVNMRKKLSLALALLCAVAVQAQVKDYALKVGDFKEFTVAHSLNVRYVQSADSAGYATFSCAPKTAHAITFSINKQKLKIEVLSDEPLAGQLPTVTVYSNTLDKVTNWGDSLITVDGPAPVAQFKAKVIGNGQIEVNDVRATKVDAAVEAGSGSIYIAGQASSAKFTIASVGAIEAGGLEIERAKCVIFGTGSVDCSPKDELTVMGAGSGNVYYTGSPRIKKRSVGVHVVQVED